MRKETPNSTSATIPDLANQFVAEFTEGERTLYVYGTAVVRPEHDHESGQWRLKALTNSDLKWHLRRLFEGAAENTTNAVADDVLHNPDLPFKRIRGLVTTPTFRKDFSLITEPGYDLASGLYYPPDPSLAGFTFRTDASRATARESLDLLFELLKDFPFKGDAGRFAFLATLLTLFLRGSIQAVVPCLGIDGNGQSVGKGLLTSILCWIAYGEDAASMSVPKSREEWASKLDSILLHCKPFQMIDNIVGGFASDDFASVLAAMRRNVRIKGLSKVVDVPVRTVWVLNGNHMDGDSDMAQRMIMCHLEHEDPASRKQEEFHIQKTYGCSIDVLLRGERAKYLQACLSIICAWVNAGAPKRRKLVLAKYGEWESYIGGIIDWLQPEAKFLSLHFADAQSIDSERDTTITFLKQLICSFPTCETVAIGVSDIAALVFSSGGVSNLRDFVPEQLLNGKAFAKALGHWLKNKSTRKWGDVEIIGEFDTHASVWRYRIGVNLKTTFPVKQEDTTSPVIKQPGLAGWDQVVEDDKPHGAVVMKKQDVVTSYLT